MIIIDSNEVKVVNYGRLVSISNDELILNMNEKTR